MLKLDLCCGYRKPEGYFGVDDRIECDPDLLWDIERNGLEYFEDNSVDEIRAHDALEHIASDRCIYVMEEIYRVLKPNGILDFFTPSTDGRGAFQDFTHKCYDEETEIMTQDGFKYFKDLTYEDLIYTLDLENNIAVLELPKEIISSNYSGDMFRWAGKQVDICVTPNHRIIIKKDWGDNKFIDIDACELFKRDSLYTTPYDVCFDGSYPEYFEIPESRLKISGQSAKKFIGNSIRLPIEPFMEFMGWWLSEGYVTYKQTQDFGGRYNFYRIGICQSESAHKEEYDLIGNCITRLGYKPYRDKIGWYFNDKSLALYLLQFGKSHEKFIPIQLKQMHPKLLELLLGSLLLGDGKKNGMTSETYTTTSYKLASDIQEIAIKCGYKTSIGLEKRIGKQFFVNQDYRAKHDMWLVYISNYGKFRYLPRNKEKIKYSGKVYCVSTENGIVLVRRNGKVLWCGNSFWNKNTLFYFMKDEYRNLYGIKAKFEGEVKNVFTDVTNKIIHVVAKLRAVKE